MEGVEIDIFGSTQADIDYLGPSRVQTLHERIGKHRAFQARTAPDDHRPRTDNVGIGVTNASSKVFVDFFRHLPSDIVGRP